MKQNYYHTPRYYPAAMYAIVVVLFVLAFFPVMRQLVETWYTSEDYSYGFFIVPISLYLIYRMRDKISSAKINPGAFGSLLVTAAILIYVFAHLAHIATLKNLALVATLWAIIWAIFGKRVFKTALFPLFLLLFMVPVPAQLFSMATNPLQLIVSKMSTWSAGMFSVPILREGNVLHLPGRTLAVVQACSGLRSLMSLAFLCAVFGYMTLSASALRTLLVACSIPIAILINVVRVLCIILAFHYLNLDLSKGMIHTFFGLSIFILALAMIAFVRGIFLKWDLKNQAG